MFRWSCDQPMPGSFRLRPNMTKGPGDEVEVISVCLSSFFNVMVECCEFPDKLKEGEITSLFKNQVAMIKKNYRPITILTSESKIFERILYDQKKCFSFFTLFMFS